jgi:hypothetical protein
MTVHPYQRTYINFKYKNSCDDFDIELLDIDKK